jgi:hypothetical protein
MRPKHGGMLEIASSRLIIIIMQSALLSPSCPPPLPVAVKQKTSSIKAGWICIGLGFVTFWTGIGLVFFSVAMILGVVAMCSNRVGAGVAVLVSALGSLALCVVLFMTLVFGTVLGGVAQILEQSPKGPTQTTGVRSNH